jgi:putative hydrolase of the HAD superfamily
VSGDLRLVIFFDVDDTLIDHSGAERKAAWSFYQHIRDHLDGLDGETFYTRWHAAAQRHFATYNAGEISYQEQRRRRIREFFGAGLSDPAADDLFKVYLVSYEASWALFPDALPCLDALRDQPLGIISNNGSEATRRKLRRMQIEDRFADVVTPDTMGVSKPDRRIFEAACARLDVSPGAAMYVGDQLTSDARAALEAGLTGVWLNRQREDESGADGLIVIHDLRALPPLLQK